MKKLIKYIILALFMCLSITNISAFVLKDEIQGNVVFNDENDRYHLRPSEVQIDLYEDDHILQSVKANSSNNYYFSFNRFDVKEESNYYLKINNQDNYDSNFVEFTKNQELVISFEKLEPNRSLEVNIGTSDIVVIKLAKQEGIVIWTKESIDENIKNQIIETVSNLNGIGKIHAVYFYTKDEEINNNLSINNGVITFDDKNVWSLIYTGNISKVIDLSIKEQLQMNLALTNISITKKVVGKQTEESYEFEIIFNNEYLNGQYGDIELENGKASFSLKDNQTITIKDIPNSIGYSLSEKEIANCQVVINGIKTNVVKVDKAKDVSEIIVVNNIEKENEGILDPKGEETKDKLPEEETKEEPAEKDEPIDKPNASEEKPSNNKKEYHVIPNTGIN